MTQHELTMHLKYLGNSHQHNTSSEKNQLPEQPTTARPGTEQKIRIMEERRKNGEQLFHPEDNNQPVLRQYGQHMMPIPFFESPEISSETSDGDDM